MRVCNKCKLPKEDDGFYPRQGQCKECLCSQNTARRRAKGAEGRALAVKRAAQWAKDHPDEVRAHNRNKKLRKYGLTQAAYDAMLAGQGGRCAICGSGEASRQRTNSSFMIDHDHATGAVRALLCNRCNRGIGLFADDPDLLQKTVEYLRTHRNKS